MHLVAQIQRFLTEPGNLGLQLADLLILFDDELTLVRLLPQSLQITLNLLHVILVCRQEINIVRHDLSFHPFFKSSQSESYITINFSVISVFLVTLGRIGMPHDPKPLMFWRLNLFTFGLQCRFWFLDVRDLSWRSQRNGSLRWGVFLFFRIYYHSLIKIYLKIKIE